MKPLEESLGEILEDIGMHNEFFGQDAKSTGNKRGQVEFHQMKNLHSEGNTRQSEESIYRMGGNIF